MSAVRSSLLLRLSHCISSSHSLRRVRPLAAAVHSTTPFPPSAAARCFATRTASSSITDPSPSWSHGLPKEAKLLEGCDFEHWLVVMEKPEGEPSRDEIIDGYIKTLAQIVGSEEEARMKIYSVSTRHYFAFGALVSEELSCKLKELPGVRWVLVDSYKDVENKDYGGEPFINGQAVPYDPKYHEEWVRNREAYRMGALSNEETSEDEAEALSDEETSIEEAVASPMSALADGETSIEEAEASPM